MASNAGPNKNFKESTTNTMTNASAFRGAVNHAGGKGHANVGVSNAFRPPGEHGSGHVVVQMGKGMHVGTGKGGVVNHCFGSGHKGGK